MIEKEYFSTDCKRLSLKCRSTPEETVSVLGLMSCWQFYLKKMSNAMFCISDTSYYLKRFEFIICNFKIISRQMSIVYCFTPTHVRSKSAVLLPELCNCFAAGSSCTKTCERGTVDCSCTGCKHCECWCSFWFSIARCKCT